MGVVSGVGGVGSVTRVIAVRTAIREQALYFIKDYLGVEIPEINFDLKTEPIESQLSDGLRKGYIAWGSIIVKVERSHNTEFPRPPCLT